MQKVTRAVLVTFLCVGGAWGADVVVDGGPTAFVVSEAAGRDATLELKWDSGIRRWSMSWMEGGDSWFGNDFDLSTISAYRGISKYKYYTRGAWPNGRWDGVRIAIYRFAGGVPGSMLWPTSGGGYFFKPSAGIQAHIWVECDINWVCPTTAFVAAQDQIYNYPYNDPFALDTNTRFVGHSWMNTTGRWEPFYSSDVAPYRNLMIRVIVNDLTSVTPTSVGRVKALYY